MKNEPHKIFYLTVSFVLHNFIENTVNSPTFCSEKYVLNFKFDENFLIRLSNKLRKSCHKYSVLNIPYGIETPKTPQDEFYSVIPPRILI